jgi:hypothetical protein
MWVLIFLLAQATSSCILEWFWFNLWVVVLSWNITIVIVFGLELVLELGIVKILWKKSINSRPKTITMVMFQERTTTQRLNQNHSKMQEEVA